MNKEKNILLINRAVYIPGEGGYKRTMYLFDMMKERGYNVTLLTSDYNHYNKKARDIDKFRHYYPDYSNIHFLHIPTYKKNISLMRYFSEKVWTKSVKKWLRKNISHYDLVMLSMPDMNTILAINELCKTNKVKMLIDIRDLRPEVFHVLVKNDFLYNFLFQSMAKKADQAYACADELIAVSREYLKRGLKSNKKSKNAEVIYIGSALKIFYEGAIKYSEKFIKPTNEFWLTYIGTIGTSYDFKTIISAMKKIEITAPNVRFKILGQGPDEERLKEYAKNIQVSNVDFMGFYPYDEMAAFLCKSDIAINNIKANASQSIINKVADYFAAGIPVLNSCKNDEMQELISEFETGINYLPENEDDFIDKFMTLYNNPEIRKQYGVNAKKLALDKFDRDNSYIKIINLIDMMTDK